MLAGVRRVYAPWQVEHIHATLGQAAVAVVAAAVAAAAAVVAVVLLLLMCCYCCCCCCCAVVVVLLLLLAGVRRVYAPWQVENIHATLGQAG